MARPALLKHILKHLWLALSRRYQAALQLNLRPGQRCTCALSDEDLKNEIATTQELVEKSINSIKRVAGQFGTRE